MTILNQTLQATGIRKTQTAFLNILFTLWLAIPGRINYTNLERFSTLNEKTFRNWFEKPVEWAHLNANLVLETIQNAKHSPLTIDEGIAILTHFPDFLVKNNCFSLLASRCGDKRVPALWISANAAKLGWCWNGNLHT